MDSSSVEGPNGGLSAVDFDLTQTYSSLSSLLDSAKRLGTENSFITSHQAKAYFKANDWPFQDTVPFHSVRGMELSRRGYIWCSSKTEGRPKGSECCFKLTYNWDEKPKQFIWRPDTSTLNHSHPLPKQVHLDGRQLVKFEGDLTDAEDSYIRDKSLCKMDIPQMQVHLEKNFPGRCFQSQMLHRIKKKVLDKTYGADRTQVNELISYGEKIKKDGGHFSIDPSPDFTVEAMHWQTKLMREYALLYGNSDGFILADGTHGITRHKVIFVFFVVVDCLMKSKIAGYTACWSEQGGPILRGAEAFFESDKEDNVEVGEIPGIYDPFVDNVVHDSEGTVGTVGNGEEDGREEDGGGGGEDGEVVASSTLMSDEGPAFEIVAHKMGWNHINDRFHISEQIEESWQGLDDPAAYKDDIFNILEEPDLDVLTNKLFPAAKEKYVSGNASIFVLKLFEQQEKFCYAHTCKHYTAGHVASQRIEGVNSSVKANGKLKIYLGDATYAEAIHRIQQVMRTSDRASIDELKQCRDSGFKVGIQILKELKETALIALQLSIVEATDDQNKYRVKESEGSVKFSTVEVDASVTWNNIEFDGIMICSCCFYTSTNKPCPCICRVCQHLQIDFQDPKIVHPRYWIVFHPLYYAALQELGVQDYADAPWTDKYHLKKQIRSRDIESSGTVEQVNASTLSVRTQAFDSFGALDKTSAAQRVTLLRNIMKGLIDVAAESATKTKIAGAQMTELTNRLGSAEFSNATLAVRPTSAISSLNRYSRDMLGRSQSSFRRKARKGPRSVGKTLKRKPAKKTRHCSVCRMHGEPANVSSNHRSGRRCPHYVHPQMHALPMRDTEAPDDGDDPGSTAAGDDDEGDDNNNDSDIGGGPDDDDSFSSTAGGDDDDEDDDSGSSSTTSGGDDDDEDDDSGSSSSSTAGGDDDDDEDDDAGGDDGDEGDDAGGDDDDDDAGGDDDIGGGADDGFDNDGDDITNEGLLELKFRIDQARNNDMFEGTVAGPLAMCVKASEGMDGLLQNFVDNMENSIRNSIVVSDEMDMSKIDEILYSFYTDHPNLKKHQIHVKKIRNCTRRIDTAAVDFPVPEEVNEFVTFADADENCPEEVIVYNQIIECLDSAHLAMNRNQETM
jgi:hypothetical protein